MNQASARTYETTFIMRPALSDLEVDEMVASVKRLLEENGCEVLKADLWGRRKLAYQIGRDYDGVYAFMVFRGPAEAVPVLERQFQINENVLRYLTVRCEVPVEEIAVRLDDRPASDRSRRGRPPRSDYRPASALEPQDAAEAAEDVNTDDENDENEDDSTEE